jgi:hypothetical protein
LYCDNTVEETVGQNINNFLCYHRVVHAGGSLLLIHILI